MVTTLVGGLYLGVSILAAALLPLGLAAAPDTERARQPRLPVMVATLLALWYGVILTVGSGDGLRSAPGGVPAVVIALVLPLALGFGALWLAGPLQRVLDRPDVQPMFIAMQTYRVAGVGFLALTALGQLPAVFGVPAGLGDIVAGLTALPAANALKQGRLGHAVAWNAFGLLDLAVALTLGVGTGPGALHFIAAPSSALFSTAPFLVVPAFVVPLDIWLHVVSLRFLLRSRSRYGGKPPHRFGFVVTGRAPDSDAARAIRIAPQDVSGCQSA